MTPAPDAVTDLGDIVLVDKGALAGRAVDEDGEPIVDAQVLAVDLPAALAALMPFDRFDPAHGGVISVPLPSPNRAGEPQPGELAAYRERLSDYLAGDLLVRGDLDRDDELSTFVVDRLPWLESIWRELPMRAHPHRW